MPSSGRREVIRRQERRQIVPAQHGPLTFDCLVQDRPGEQASELIANFGPGAHDLDHAGGRLVGDRRLDHRPAMPAHEALTLELQVCVGAGIVMKG
jgi:hypothetical protein